jgi:hypothetical protein
MAGREDREAAQLLPRVTGQRIEQRQRFEFVVEQGDAHRKLGVLGREDVDHVAAHAIGAALEVDLVALVLHFRQAADDLALADLFAHAQVQDHAVVIDRVADAVDADTVHTITTSRRSSRLLVADRRICSMCSLIEESFSMNRSREGT